MKSAASPVPSGAVRFRDISRIPLILPSMPHSNRRLVERAALQHGTRLQVAIEVDSIPLTNAMVAGGFGATILTTPGSPASSPPAS